MSACLPNLRGTVLACACGWSILLLSSNQGYSQTLTASAVATGLELPVYAAAPPGDTDRLLVTERLKARISVVDLATEAVLPTPFLDLPDIVAGNQSGLQAFAFHPDYATNGRFYINYSDGSRVRIEEYTVSADPNVADIATARPILSYPHTNNHNGGWLDFSPVDGYLYIGTGDGGTSGTSNIDRGIDSQDLSSLKGKILRIDVDGDDFPADPDSNYRIPATNPFVETAARPEVWAYGLRHPYRGSFDPVSGDLYIGDVGSAHWEEVNFQAGTSGGGENYGWRAVEGFLPNPTFSDPIPVDAVDPLHAFVHGGSAAVIGGYVYRAETIPSLQGNYFYADFPNAQVFSFDVDGGTPLNVVDRTAELSPAGSGPLQGIAGWGRDGRGDLYLIDTFAGALYKIRATSNATAHVATDVWIGVSDGLWSADENWEDLVAPIPGGANDQVLEFNYSDAGPAPTFTNDLAGTFVLNGLVLNSPGEVGFSVAGNELEFAVNSSSSDLPFISAVGATPVSVGLDLVVQDVLTLDGAGSEVTFGGVVSGPGGLIIDRPDSTTILAGDSTYSGETVVRGGTLILSGNAASSPAIVVEHGGKLKLDYAAMANKLDDAATVTLEFAELDAQNFDAATVQEDFGSLILRADSTNTIHLTGDAASMVVLADSLVRESGAVAVVRGDDFGQAASDQLRLVTPPTLVGGSGAEDSASRSIVPMIVGDMRVSGGGIGLVTYDAAGGLAMLDLQTEYATEIVAGTATDDNVRLASAISNIDAPSSVNALLLDVGGSIAGASSLTIASGNLLAADANAAIDVGSLELSASEAMIWTVEDLAVSADLIATADVTKAGSATLTLSGATTIPGKMAVLDGTLAVSGGTFAANALLVRGPNTRFSASGGTVTLDAATIGRGGKLALSTGESITVAGATTIEPNGTIHLDGGTLHTDSLANTGGNLFFVAGELDFTGPALSIGPAGPLGTNVVLDAPKSLRSAGTTTIVDAQLHVQGGSFASPQLVLEGPNAAVTTSAGTFDVDELHANAGAILSLVDGQTLAVNDRVTIDSASRLDLLGGTLRVGEVVNNGGVIDFSSGTLQLTAVGLTVANGSLLGDVVELQAGQIVDLFGVTTIEASGSLTLAGGSLITPQIVNNGGVFDFDSGSLRLTGSDLAVDASGFFGAELSLAAGQDLIIDGVVTVSGSGRLTMASGNLTAAELIVDGPAATLVLNGPSPTMSNFRLQNGAQHQLAVGQHLIVDGEAHVAAGSSLQLTGGSLTAGRLTVDGALSFDSGLLELTDQGLNIAVGELFGPVLSLRDGQQLAVAQDVDVAAAGMVRLEAGSSLDAAQFLNDGVLELDGTTATLTAGGVINNRVIRGTGRILADLSNNQQGEIRVQNNEQLSIQGVAHANAGTIDVLKGEVSFLGSVTNNAGQGEIRGRDATLRFSDGLNNGGAVNLSFGVADLFGDIANAAGGTIVISGSSQATFYDDFDNEGELRTSAGSSAVFFGAVTGAGVFTGTGTNQFEGPVQPGNSPAEMAVAGDVRFGPAAQLEIEIGGTTPGQDHDVLSIDGTAVAAGTLAVEWITIEGDPYAVQPGDEFVVLTALGGLSGEFTPELPTLPGGLQWQLDYSPISLALSVDYLLAADFDDNGAVAEADLHVWQAGYGLSSDAIRKEGDADRDGDVDGRDFLRWQSEFGQSFNLAARIPEPPSALLVMVCLMAAISCAGGRGG